MKVLVTGGAGCIGSEVAQAFVELGCEVTVLDNLSSGRIEHIRDLLPAPNFRFVEGDLLDAEVVNRCVSGIDRVLHLAANPDVKFVPGDATDKDLRQNTLATYTLLEAMRVHGVGELGFASTSAIYGLSNLQPIPEHVSPRPISLYGATKLGCEALISAFSHLFGIRSWVFRFANIVGPKVRKNGRTVIADFIHRLRENPMELTILGDGKQAKSYLLVEECVEAMLFLMGHAKADFNVFNIGCCDSISVTRIADMVVEAMGLHQVQYRFTGGEGGWPGDVPRFRLDVEAINQLGWKARRHSEEAVSIAIRETLRNINASSPAGGNECRR